MSKVYLASDHAGFELKKTLIPYIGSLGHEVEDEGPYVLDPTDDYPDSITPCAQKVALEQGSFGIVLGASGQGEAMCANRIKGIRAGVYYAKGGVQTDSDGNRLDIVASIRMHDDGNVLSLGARFISEDEAKEAVRVFLATPFSGAERHTRRIQKF